MKRLTSIFLGCLALAAQAPGPRDKCPVCGMFVAKFPQWVAVVTFKDGARSFTDGPKDALRLLADLKRLGGGRTPDQVSSCLVKDYYSLRPVEAREAFYVVGSDVTGPMGRELVPFATRADAEAFTREHHGQGILRYADLTPARLKALD